MLPSDMNLKIRSGTVRYNNKILVSDEKFSLGKNDKVNSLDLAKVVALDPSIKSHKVVAEQTHAHELSKKPTPRTAERGASTSRAPPRSRAQGPHEEEKTALVLFLAGGFTIWVMFQ